MNNVASFDAGTLNALEKEYESVLEDYLRCYNEMESLVKSVKDGSISGPAAELVVSLFDNKKDVFENVKKFVEEGKAELGLKIKQGNTMLDEITADLK